MSSMWQDLRFAVRALARRPGFTATSVVTLALAIGALTAIFSVVDTVLLRPLPFPEPDRLVAVWELRTERGTRFELAPANFLDLERENDVFAGVAAIYQDHVILDAGDGAERIAAQRVSASFFRVLGVEPERGRVFAPGEDEPGGDRVVVLGGRLWRERFGADPGVVGRTIQIDGEPSVVVGVMPAGFVFDRRDVQIWQPLILDGPLTEDRQRHVLHAVARLEPDVARETARAGLDALGRRLAERHPATNEGSTLTVVDLREQQTGSVRTALVVLLAAVVLVLFIACLNVAGLGLVRGQHRAGEIAIRTALGAGRVRTMRQLLTESALLAILGAGGGLLLAGWTIDALAAAPVEIPRLEAVRMDGRILGWTLLTTAVTALLAGLVPAWIAARAPISQVLRHHDHGAAGRRPRTRDVFVVAQLALALVLLVGAGLLTSSFVHLTGVDPGFETEGLLTLRVASSPASSETATQIYGFYERLLEAVERLPGVSSTAATQALPWRGSGSTAVDVEGRAEPPSRRPTAAFRQVSDDFFRTLGIPLLRGRGFDQRDARVFYRDWEDPGSSPVVLINQRAARELFAGTDPVGQRLRLGPDDPTAPWHEIVGVVGDARLHGPEQTPRAEVYELFGQHLDPTMYLVVRTATPPETLIEPIRETLRRIDPGAPMFDVRTFEQVAAGAIARQRLTLQLMAVFSALALGLAALGVYGVVAHAVSLRRRELGIRVALGASRADIARLVLGHGLLLTAIGLGLGLLGAVASTRFLADLLFGARTLEPSVLLAVTVLLAAVALLASYLPARRAARLSPTSTLRAE